MISTAPSTQPMSLETTFNDGASPLPRLRGNGIKAWNGHGPDATLNPDLWYLAGGRGKPPTRNYFEDRRLRCRDAGVTHHYWTSKGSIAGHKGGILWWWKKKKKGGNQSRDQSRDVSQGLVSGETMAARFGEDETFANPPPHGHRREMATASTGHRTTGDHRAPSGSALAHGRAPRHAPPATTTGRSQQQPYTLPHRPRAAPPHTQRQPRSSAAAPPPPRRQPQRSRPAPNEASTSRSDPDLGGDGANGGVDLTTVEGYDQQNPPRNPAAGEVTTDSSAFPGQGVRVGGLRRDRARVPVHAAPPNAAAGGRQRSDHTRTPLGRAPQASSADRAGARSSGEGQARERRGAGRRGHGRETGSGGGQRTETTDVHGAAGRSVYGR